MAFPSSQLPLYAGIAPGADPVDPSTWAFEEITDDVRTASGVQIQVGRQDEGSQVDTTRTNAVVDNRSGDYCRVNPMGQWSGQLDRGTPVEYRVTRISDTFTRTTSPGWGTEPNSGMVWGHSSTSVWATTGSAGTATFATANSAAIAFQLNAVGDDVEISGSASVPAVMTGAAFVLAPVVRYSSVSNFYRLHVEFGTGGVLGVKIVKVQGGSSSDLTSVAATGDTYGGGTVVRWRARAVGPTLQVRAWLASNTEPTVWHATVDDDSLTGQATGVYAWRVSGNTNVGSLAVTVDDFRMDVIRASTPVAEWPVRWDQSGNDATAPIVGAGVMRRLSQGQSAVRSPIYRQLSAQSAAGYWPLEDGSGATVAASGLPAGYTAAVVDAEFGNSDCPPGASSSLTLRTAGTSKVAGRSRGWPVPQDGHAALCYAKLPTLPVSASPVVGQRLMDIAASGTAVRWVVYAKSAGFHVEAYNAADAKIVDSSPFTYGMSPTEWFAVQLEAEEVGGNVNWALIWHQVGSDTFFSDSGSFAGTANLITSGTLLAPVADTLVSHFWLGDDDIPFVNAGFTEVSAGYAGEKAGERLQRLAADEGVPLRVFGDVDDTALMGAQRSATFLELAHECEAADQGVLIECGPGLGYVTREFRYNQDPVLELDFDAGHIAEPPEPTDDDQRLRNQIKLSRVGGSEVTVQDDDSIARAGTYSDELAVNLNGDNQLVDHAGWRLSMGTFDDLRWPRLELDLARNPSLIADWCRVRIGSRITVANPPDQVGTSSLDLIVEGWTETLSAYGWDVVLACSPAQLWEVGFYGTGTAADLSWDSKTSRLNEALTTAETIWDCAADDPNDCWSSDLIGQQVIVGGEVCTVTAVGVVSGSGPYLQTITCTRSVNGVVKTHTTGERIQLAPGAYARWAL